MTIIALLGAFIFALACMALGCITLIRPVGCRLTADEILQERIRQGEE